MWPALTLKRLLRRKLRRRWFFDISEVKESSFFLNRTSLTAPSDFWCASFGKYRFRPFQISFFSGFYIKIMFWVRWFYSLFERMRSERKRTMLIHTNQPLITSIYIGRYLFFAELLMSQRWSAFFCATGAWGGKPIGCVRVHDCHNKMTYENASDVIKEADPEVYPSSFFFVYYGIRSPHQATICS